MGRPMLDDELDRFFHFVDFLTRSWFFHRVCHRVVAAHLDALPHHDRGPAGFGKQLFILSENLAVLTE